MITDVKVVSLQDSVHMPRLRTTLLGLTAASLVLASCTDPNSGQLNRTQTGVAVGAALGGLFGLSRDGDAPAEAVLGAIVGGAIGGAIGNQLDKQAAELQRDLGASGATVVNTGDRLVVTMPQDILFAVDSTSVQPGLQSDLATLARSLNDYPNTTIDVIGHTDNTGAAGYNQNLSQRRAQAVTSILQSNGVSAGRLRSIGRGEDAPVASNLNESGRSQNRRVEIIIRPNTA
jgi:outer membrane protein OmpA-like peptidoglycan-associated protein